ncbi:unnamed protein product [Moneuplotes crassus]|uniref:Uncharacterized protein n=1 Tax=Euplotes crassus TaxID=5936 RepID=A0AAD1UA11_EUPCR|nr:unnamed protein product [Moneuplotes crassus]
MIPQICTEIDCKKNVEVYVPEYEEYYCSGCAASLYSDKTQWLLFSPSSCTSSLEQIEYVLDNIEQMASFKSLQKCWKEYLSELKVYKADLETLRDEFSKIKKKRRWIEIGTFQNQCDSLLNAIYQDEMMNLYTKHLMTMSLNHQISPQEALNESHKANASHVEAQSHKEDTQKVRETKELATHTISNLQTSVESIQSQEQQLKEESKEELTQEVGHEDIQTQVIIEEMKEQIAHLETQLEASNKEMDHTTFKELYHAIKGYPLHFVCPSKLNIDLSKTEGQRLVKLFQTMKLPELDEVVITSFKNFNCPQLIGNFLASGMHSKIRGLILDFNDNSYENFSREFSSSYLDAIKDAAKFPSECFALRNFTLNQQQFTEMLVLAKEAQCIQVSLLILEQALMIQSSLNLAL